MKKTLLNWIINGIAASIICVGGFAHASGIGGGSSAIHSSGPANITDNGTSNALTINSSNDVVITNNLGIGAAPTDELHLTGADPTIKLTDSGAYDWTIVGQGASGDGRMYLGRSGWYGLNINHNGNFYFGLTTYTDWHNTNTALQIGGTGSVFSDRNAGTGKQMYIGQNVLENTGGSLVRISADESSYYMQANGSHYYRTAPSGSAGGAASFSNQMTLNADQTVDIYSDLDLNAGSVLLDNAEYVWGETLAGTPTRMLGINASDEMYIGSIDASVNNLLFNIQGSNVVRMDNDGGLFIAETASASADVTAFGQLWVKNNTPNELWFTDDAGTDHAIIGKPCVAGYKRVAPNYCKNTVDGFTSLTFDACTAVLLAADVIVDIVFRVDIYALNAVGYNFARTEAHDSQSCVGETNFQTTGIREFSAVSGTTILMSEQFTMRGDANSSTGYIGILHGGTAGDSDAEANVSYRIDGYYD